mmetsp:Transcript_71447/g.231386  ORF Transcript_71447/g.231386 Transcript_71447/m.231386 type:complete len:229 (+) Transcript_71447:487-1173(+)
MLTGFFSSNLPLSRRPLSSQKPAKSKICNQPSTGTFEKAASPFGTSSNFTPRDGDSSPGKRKYSGAMKPMVAIMATRPCLISTARRRLKSASSPSLQKPAGSQNPTGSCTPSCFVGSKAARAVFVARARPRAKAAATATPAAPSATAGTRPGKAPGATGCCTADSALARSAGARCAAGSTKSGAANSPHPAATAGLTAIMELAPDRDIGACARVGGQGASHAEKRAVP